MFAWSSHGTELKRFRRQPITRAAIAVMLLIPLLYGAMYVWAFWDPTSRMNDLPVALVNADVATTDDGRVVSYGQDVVDELTDDASLGWALVDADTAKAGLESGKYYFSVTIPADFSTRIESLGGDEPLAASIDVTYDDSNSFLASTLGKTAMLEVQRAVREKVSQEAVDTLLVGVGDARHGFAKASDGAFELRDGLTDAADGADRLNVGASDLAEGAARLAAGTVDAATGAHTLAGKLGDYVSGVSKASAGAQQLRDGAAGLTALQDGLAQVADPATGAPALASGVRELAGGVNTLASGAGSFATGAGTFATGAGDWVTGAQAWRSGAYEATGGKLTSGTAAVASGATALADETASGSDLRTGAAAVATGNSQLAAGLGSIDEALAKAQKAQESGDADSAARIIAAARDQLHHAQGSAGALAKGAGTVSDGIGDLHTGASKLATGADAVQTGWASVHGALASDGALGAPLSTLDAGQRQLTTGADSLAEGAAQLADPATLAKVKQLETGADRLSTALGALSDGASDPEKGIPALQSGIGSLAAAFTASDPEAGLVSGAKALRAGAATLADGLADARDGAARLSAGSSELAANTPALADGLGDATAGADELGGKLADGAAEIPNDSSAVRSDRAEAIAVPVSVAADHVHEADSWGEGFAPFFISLALWVGALITWLLLRPLQTRALMTSVNGFRMAWGSLNSALLLSLGQVAIMLSVMHFAIGLNPVNVVATFAFTMLAAAAFFALQQFFQVALGSAVGKVVIIVALMVQLASAGGTYPIQTTPSFLQAISPYLPMTYVVNGLRETITGGMEARFWTSVAVLAAIFVVSLAATSIVSARKRMWTMSRLHPALSI